MYNAQLVEQAIQDIQKAISSTDVSGLLLVREDLQAEMAIQAPTDTPLRNRLNRIPGNGKAQYLGLVKFGYMLGNPKGLSAN